MSYPSTDYVYINVNGTNFTIQTNFGNIIRIKGNNTISNNSLFLIIKSNNNINSYIYTTTGFTLKKAYSITVRDVVFGQYSYSYAISSSISTIYKINLNSPYDVSSISFSNEDIQKLSFDQNLAVFTIPYTMVLSMIKVQNYLKFYVYNQNLNAIASTSIPYQLDN